VHLIQLKEIIPCCKHELRYIDTCSCKLIFTACRVATIKVYRVIKKEIYTFKILFYKNTDAKSISCAYGWKGNLTKFWYRWSEAGHHWGCGCCCPWHAATSIGNAGISICHPPRHTWDSHRVLVRCENNFGSSLFSLYIEHRHMFNSTCKINFWKFILLFE
jgi:hypothetical protein